MTTKKLRAPRTADYPITLSEIFVREGAEITRGAPLCELRTATGKRMMMRAPMAGQVVQIMREAGAQLEAPEALFGLSEAVEDAFAEVEEEEADAPAAAPETGSFTVNERMRSMAPDYVPPAGPAEPAPEEPVPPAAEAAAEPAPQDAKRSGLLSLVLMFAGLALPVAVIYAALHLAHSARFGVAGGVMVVLAALAAGQGLVWCVQKLSGESALGTVGWIGTYCLALPLAFASAFVPLGTLQRHDSDLLHKLVTPLTGGALQIRDGQLVALGRSVQGEAAQELRRGMRLGVSGAVLEKDMIYTEEGRFINPLRAIARRTPDVLSSFKPFVIFNCLEADWTRDTLDERYPEWATFVIYLKTPRGDLEGYQARFDSLGEIVGLRELRRSAGSGASSCSEPYSKTHYRLPEL